MDVLETAVTLPFWNAMVWYPPPGLGTTTVPCTAPNSPPSGPGPAKAGPNGTGPWMRPKAPLGGSVRNGGLADGADGDTVGAGLGEDEPVAATATPAPASTPTAMTPART